MGSPLEKLLHHTHPTQERVRLVLVDNEDGDDVSIISEICVDEPPPRHDEEPTSDDEVMPTPKRRGPPVSREKPPPKRRRDPPKRSQMKHPSQEEKHAWPANAPHGAGLIGHKIRVWWPHDRAWFVGHVNAFDGGRLHEIRYEDGEDWDEDLEQRRWELVATAAKRAPPPKARKPAPAPKRRAAESSSDDDAAPVRPRAPPSKREHHKRDVVAERAVRAAEEDEDDDDDDEAKDQRLAFVAFKAKLAHERYGLGPPNLEGWRAWRKQNWLKSKPNGHSYYYADPRGREYESIQKAVMAFVSMEREGNGVDVDHLRRKRHQRREQLREEESSEEEMGPDTRPLLTCRKCGAFTTRHPPARSNHEKKCLGSAEANAAKLTPWEREKERRRNDPTYVPYQPPPKIDPKTWRCNWCGSGVGTTGRAKPGPDGPYTLCDICYGRHQRGEKGPRKIEDLGKFGRFPLTKKRTKKAIAERGPLDFRVGATSTGTGTPCGPSATSC